MTRKPSVLRLIDAIDIIHSFKNFGISPFVLHGIDVAKVYSGILKRLKPSIKTSRSYLAGLLHDIGLVIYLELYGYLLEENIQIYYNPVGLSFDMGKMVGQDKDQIHAEISYEIVRRLGILSNELLLAIKYHHTPVERIPESDEIKLLANALSVADDISNLFRKNIRYGEDVAYNAIANFLLSDEVLGDVKKAAVDFLMDLYETVATLYSFSAPFEPESAESLSIEQIEEFFKIFLMIVDLRSPFTYKHSNYVSLVAREISKEIFRNDCDTEEVFLAALVHDLGKLSTPLKILHKPGKLSRAEYHVMKLHVVNTYMILNRIERLDKIASIASLHHERLDGSGYPWRLKEDEIGLKARILQVSDVFVALTEPRPYREAMSYREALSILEDMANHRKLDGYIFNLLKNVINNGFRFEYLPLIPEEYLRSFSNHPVIARLFSSIA